MDNCRKNNKFYYNFNFSCLAGGYPTPTYEWFKEEYNNEDQLMAIKIDPLNNSRFTLSGGTLIIYEPKRVKYIDFNIFLKIVFKIIMIIVYIYILYRTKIEANTIVKLLIYLVLWFLKVYNFLLDLLVNLIYNVPLNVEIKIGVKLFFAILRNIFQVCTVY